MCQSAEHGKRTESVKELQKKQELCDEQLNDFFFFYRKPNATK